jgi:predicted transcriptional regulator
MSNYPVFSTSWKIQSKSTPPSQERSKSTLLLSDKDGGAATDGPVLKLRKARRLGRTAPCNKRPPPFSPFRKKTMSDSSRDATRTIELTADIVAAYVANNAVTRDDVAALIASVDAALKALVSGDSPAAPPAELVPAVPVKKSVTPDFIICLEDGKKFKSLKRHLRSAYNLSPDAYRAKWGLPANYPMVAPAYAERRSELAKANGLGRVSEKGQPTAKGAKPRR